MAWSRSGPTNSSAMSSHMPSSTCLPSNSTRRVLTDRAAWAVIDVDQAGFAAAGLAAGEDVAVDDPDVDRLTEFIDAQVDGVIHGQGRADRVGVPGPDARSEWTWQVLL